MAVVKENQSDVYSAWVAEPGMVELFSAFGRLMARGISRVVI